MATNILSAFVFELEGAHDQETDYGIWYTYYSSGTVNQYYEYHLNGSGHVIGNIVSCWNGRNRSSYRDWGADHKKNTADDLRAEIVFDNWGRTVCTYTTNSDSTEILGSSAASYVQNSGTVTTVLDFIYDESGKPFAVIDQLSAQPKTYYYVLNLQGDVVKLIDQDGAVAASYEYDAWGNVLSQSGSMAEKNPLRYRGYYYDSETGFYYLQSRYYDPATRRFINADVYSSTDSSDAVSCNMFVYCGNNPTASSDSDGEFWHIVIGAVIGAVANALSTAVDAVKESGWDALSDGKTWAKIGTSALAGAINGGVTASGVGALAAGVVGGITGGLEEVAHQSIDAGRITVTDWKKVATKSATGFASGYSSGGAARNLHYEKTLGFSSTITDRALAKVRASGISAGYKYYMKNTWTLQKRVIKSIAKDAGEGVLKSFAKTATGLSSYI